MLSLYNQGSYLSNTMTQLFNLNDFTDVIWTTFLSRLHDTLGEIEDFLRFYGFDFNHYSEPFQEWSPDNENNSNPEDEDGLNHDNELDTHDNPDHELDTHDNPDHELDAHDSTNDDLYSDV